METISVDSHNYLNYQDTPWDTNVLGFRTNEINEIVYSNDIKLLKLVSQFEDHCVNQEVFFTNIRIRPDDYILRRVLCSAGYQNTETSLFLELGIKRFAIDNTLEKVPLSIRQFNQDNLEELKEISFQIFSHGRFFEDPYIEKEKAQIRNMNWILDLSKYSDIFLGEAHSRIVGFMAVLKEKDQAVFQLGGMKKDFTLFTYPFWYKLIIELRNKKSVNKISAVISANNIRIMNLYTYFNFKFSKAYFGYHKHRILNDTF